MTKALVTGGAGFLASHLCDFLLSKGYSVICIDDLITGNIKNVEHLIKNEEFTIINHDITRELYIIDKIDYIFHFASPASPIDYLKYPIQTLKVGSIGTLNLLGMAKEHNARFLLASTSEVYGDPLVNPQPEEYWGNCNPIGPRSVYDESKRFAEAMVMAYYRHHHLDTRIARIFNTYGPRMRANDGRLVPNFICQALKNDDLTVYGDGSQTRSLCYVTDLIDGVYRLMISDYNLPVNIGNLEEHTIIEFAKIISRIIGSKSKIIFEELPEDDPKQRRPDITKAKEIIGWEPKISLDEGLRKTIEYFKDEYHRD